MITNLQKWGNSQGIRLPKHLLDILKWNNDEELIIKAENDKIIIERNCELKRKSIQELFVDFEGEYIPIKVDWGTPVGDEIW